MTGNWRDRFEPRSSSNPATPSPFGAEAPMEASQRRQAAHAPQVDPFSGEGALSPQRTQPAPPDDDTLGLDLSVYRPWIAQRARGRPAMMLDLRRYDARSGLWTGWAVAYPHLVALEYTGDRLLSLDFGVRHFMIEGYGLGELIQRIQEGTALAVFEYSSRVWPDHPAGQSITIIRRHDDAKRND